MPDASVLSWPSAVRVRKGGRELIAFSGCNYLGLTHHPKLIAAASAELRRSGVGANGSRVTTGTCEVHQRLEQALARLIGMPAALVTLDGTLANLAAFEGLAESVPMVAIDERAHASLTLAARASGLDVESYPHLEVEAVVRIGARNPVPFAIATDSVFGALGARANLRELSACAGPRSWLLVDDSHGLGVLGPGGAGAVLAEGLLGARVIVTASLAKGLGCAGGVVAGPADLIETLQRSSVAFRGVTALAPSLAAAACAAIEVLSEEPELSARLQQNAERVRLMLGDLGLPAQHSGLPIFTITARSEQELSRMARGFDDAGLFVPLIDYAGGPAARYFRLAVSAQHGEAELSLLEQTLRRLLRG